MVFDGSIRELSLPVKADEAQTPPSLDWQPTLHQKLIIYTLGGTSLIVALDASIISTTLSAMIADLGGDATQAFWIGTSYLLVNAVMMPFICSLSDIFGRPICFEFSLAMFTIGTIVCCTAHDVTQMIAGRCIQGVGGAGIHALGLVILTDIVPLRFRPKWYGVTLGGWAVGLSMGPIIGGGIVEHTTWRVVFYIMFPICIYGLVVTPYLLTLKPPTATLRQKLARVDWIGGGLFICSATSFLIGTSWGGIQYAWNSAQTIVPLVLGVLGMVATIIYENNMAKEPYLRKSLWLNTSSIITYINGCFHGLAMLGHLYYVPFYFLSVQGKSPLDAGVAVLPLLLTALLSAIITGRLVTRFNNYRWSICLGWLVATIGAGLLIIWPVNDSIPVWVISELILGLGAGAVLNAQNFSCQAMCKPGDEAAAAAMYLFSRQFGFALGVGIGGTSFQNVMALKLGWDGLPVDLAHEAEGFVSQLHSLPGGRYKDQIIDAYNFGFIGCFSVFLGVSVVASILSVLFVKQFDMNKVIETEHELQHNRIVGILKSKPASVPVQDERVKAEGESSR